MSLMREEAKGAYQGVAEAATATVQVFGPAILTLAVGTYGARGWLLVAGIFLLAALPVPVLTRRAVESSARVLDTRAGKRVSAGQRPV